MGTSLVRSADAPQATSLDQVWQEQLAEPWPEPAPTQTFPTDDTPEEQANAEQERDAALVAICGTDFPLASSSGDPTDEGKWVAWAASLWLNREASMTYALWIAQRNRDFYAGRQWLDSEGVGRKWVTPRAPSDSVRFVVNLIRPAINLRAQIVSEQRPGFKTEPTNRDPQSKRKAEARQLALEYSWKERKMDQIHSELARWCCTDGCAFAETYWDDQAGPIHELLTGQSVKLGDIRTRVLRIDEVRVSANATATVAPDWMVVRRLVPTGEAVSRWGEKVALESAQDGQLKGTGTQGLYAYTDAGRQDDRFYDTPTLEEYTVYVRPNDYLPKGLQVHCVGQKVTYIGELLFGLIPVARYTDGSKDPAYFPEPDMNGWTDGQVGINMVVSKWIESIRRNAGGTFLARPQVITSETRMMGALSLVEVQGTGALDDVVKALPQQGVGTETIQFLTFLVQQFEQQSGWNDATRGSFDTGTSGRAILAIREQVERIFAPLVTAFEDGATEDGHIALAGMRWGYELPREIAIVGKSRVDLAREISSEDLDGVSDVEIVPMSLMPRPFSLNMFMLDNDLQRGVIDIDEYKRRREFAWTDDMGSGDEDDRDRAFRIADLIRQGMPEMQLPPALPMDNAAVHMDILRREILLDDDLPMEVRAVAFDRYMIYQNMQAQAMAAAAAMQMPQGASPSGGKPHSGASFGPKEAPLAGSHPSVGAAPEQLSPSELGNTGQGFSSLSA